MKTMAWKSHKKEMLKDPKLILELDRIEPEFEIARQIIKLRIKNKMTQTDLAAKAGTSQVVISKIESGEGNPTTGYLKKIGKAFDKELKIQFV